MSLHKLPLSKGKYNAEDRTIRKFESAQKDWYTQTVIQNANSHWLSEKELMPASEMVFGLDADHVFTEVNVSFPVPFFGQEVQRFIITRYCQVTTRSHYSHPN